MKKKILTLLGCAVVIFSISAFTKADIDTEQPRKPENLQILPEDISSDDLMDVMRSFNYALNVKCGYCHAPQKDNVEKLDFASDENPMKDVARYMMKMTQEINDNHFKDHKKDGVLMQIGCQTCHNGHPDPVMREIH